MSRVMTQPEPAQGQGDSAGDGDFRQGADDGDAGAPAPEEDSPRLTVAAVARRMGIAPAPLRTWTSIS